MDDLLGPAEQHVVKTLQAQIKNAKHEAERLAVALDKIDTDGIAEAMLSSDRKEAVIKLLEAFERLPRNLVEAQLMALMAEVIAKPKVAP